MNDRQDPKPPTIEQLIVHKIHVPAFVASLRNRCGTAMQAESFPASVTHADMQAFEAVQAVHAVVVDRQAFPTQQDTQTALIL